MAIQDNPHARGLAVIFTNDYKHTTSPLEGPFEDGKRLETAFKEINFDVHWKKNSTSAELRAIMDGLSKFKFERIQHYKCMVFVFSGHGQPGKISMQDDQDIDICDDFIDPVLPGKAPEIGDVPKIFLIDACRGRDETDTALVPTSLVTREAEAEGASKNPRADTTRGFNVQLQHLPKKGNFLVAYSTLPGCVSLDYNDDELIGSLWLKIIASKVPVACESIEDLLTLVNEEMMEKANKEGFDFQQPEKLARLNKLVVLKDLGTDKTDIETLPGDPIWGDKPTLGYLQLLKWYDSEKKELRLLKELDSSWTTVAATLHLSERDIKSIKMHHSANLSECIRDVLSRWLSNGSMLPQAERYPVNWRGFFHLLIDSEECDSLATLLKDALSAEKSNIRKTLK